MSDYFWRVREGLFGDVPAQPDAAADLAATAFADGETPIVLADYSDRSGDSTFTLQQVVDKQLSGVLVATVRDERVIEALVASDAKPGDLFSMAVGGFAAPSSGDPVNIDELLWRGFWLSACGCC
jgi:microcystin degradation protein MlrC